MFTQGVDAGAVKQGDFRIELCDFWLKSVPCQHGVGCRFAHGPAQLRKITLRDDLWRTKPCRNFAADKCSYGNRCRFRH
ncbi:hypothetical protein TSUD_383250 [Trifolium subterraneum]|uniref:C3H1-type domain-containing protein n=1 Tax=Trifolium subterraneum TaxID=3900 RepID=A0A2Z6M401_TRISU|nr:hypothetical protein TSUD_383250 [Trifolium subterraneum]